ncbi:MAG TPA: SMC-Scp complex subunit ScpB [Sporichthyaceae bacterium]|nr:SMC-Scp complex subunit ScpB [Sporichthyaceae bacterium]
MTVTELGETQFEPTDLDVTEEEPTPVTGDPAPALAAALEAVLLVVDAPVTEAELATACQAGPQEVRDTLHALAADYEQAGRGFMLRQVAGGWRFYTHPACAGAVERFVRDGQQARLTQAALETLAVVAYRQPVSRSRVSAVRGVNVDGVMRTLLTRGLVEEAGTETESGATLYRTTGYFLDRLGLTSLAELPELAPFLPEIDALGDDLGLPTS